MLAGSCWSHTGSWFVAFFYAAHDIYRKSFLYSTSSTVLYIHRLDRYCFGSLPIARYYLKCFTQTPRWIYFFKRVCVLRATLPNFLVKPQKRKENESRKIRSEMHTGVTGTRSFRRLFRHAVFYCPSFCHRLPNPPSISVWVTNLCCVYTSIHVCVHASGRYQGDVHLCLSVDAFPCRCWGY